MERFYGRKLPIPDEEYSSEPKFLKCFNLGNPDGLSDEELEQILKECGLNSDVMKNKRKKRL